MRLSLNQQSFWTLAADRELPRMVAAGWMTSSRGEKRAWQQSRSRNSSPSEGGRENGVVEVSTA